MFAGWHEPVECLISATDEVKILKNGAYDLAPLKRWGYGRVMLLGDAAHPCTPNLGLGGALLWRMAWCWQRLSVRRPRRMWLYCVTKR
jgi:2-polyprenyl-6-methoxyphenol hydroxylase-like FAD-dependent oxidoreductase